MDKSTIPPGDSGTNGRERVLRAVSIGLITTLVLAGLIGLLGVRTGLVVGSGSGYQIEVTHAEVTRAGLPTPFAFIVRTADGLPLPRQVSTRIDGAYLAMFDENGLDPDPATSSQTERWIYWTFDVPAGHDELEVSFDARLEPAVQWGRDGSVALVDGDDELAVAVFHTWVIP